MTSLSLSTLQTENNGTDSRLDEERLSAAGLAMDERRRLAKDVLLQRATVRRQGKSTIRTTGRGSRVISF